ncbi:hypothetical protein GQ53DRAFT_802964 [Thozetella sp. PMI_491]|nr:hypothetical protein GQ53DRAFT_802964 [Thozetella sp. PMI_491]
MDQIISGDLTTEEFDQVLVLMRDRQTTNPYRMLSWKFPWFSALLTENRRHEMYRLAAESIEERWRTMNCWNDIWRLPEVNLTGLLPEEGPDWSWPWQASGDGTSVPTDSLAVDAKRSMPHADLKVAILTSYDGPHSWGFRGALWLVTQPWYRFKLDVAMEEVRIRRLSSHSRICYGGAVWHGDARSNLEQRWREAGHWVDQTISEDAWQWWDRAAAYPTY